MSSKLKDTFENNELNRNINHPNSRDLVNNKKESKPDRWSVRDPVEFNSEKLNGSQKHKRNYNENKPVPKNMDKKGIHSTQGSEARLWSGRNTISHLSTNRTDSQNILKINNHNGAKKKNIINCKQGMKHSDLEQDGWITVKKNKKKVSFTAKPDPRPESEPDSGSMNNNTETESLIVNTDLSEAEKEEKKRLKMIRAQRIKEEKKRSREEKQRLIKEVSRRDTKVSFISQDAINSLSRPSHQSGQNNNFRQNNFQQPFQDCTSEYPTLGGSHKYQVRQIQKPPPPIINNINEKKNISYASLTMTAKKTQSTSISQKPSFISKEPSTPPKNTSTSKLSKRNNTAATDKNYPGSLETEVNDSPSKKKVRSRDLINLEIMDLIKLKRKEQVVAPEATVTMPPPKVEFRGKVSEGKAKKLSTLKKNMQRQKEIQGKLWAEITSNENSIQDLNRKEQSEIKKATSSAKEKKPKKEVTSPSSVSLTQNADGKETSSKHTFVPAASEPEKCVKSFDQEAHGLLLKEMQNMMNPIHNRRFREYCHHMLSPEIDHLLKECITLLVNFQDRLYKQDPMKAKMKRRYYCGLKEALKHMTRLTCLVMAPNLKYCPGQGCVDELVWKVLAAASNHGVTVVFGLTHHAMGKLCRKKSSVSCIGIINIQGAQDSYHELLELLPKAKLKYEELLPKVNSSPPGAEELKEGNVEVVKAESVTDSLLEALRR